MSGPAGLRFGLFDFSYCYITIVYYCFYLKRSLVVPCDVKHTV